MLQKNNFKRDEWSLTIEVAKRTNNDQGRKDLQPTYNHISLGQRESLEILSYSFTKHKNAKTIDLLATIR